MGYIKHTAIVVTDWDEERVRAIRERAVACFAGEDGPIAYVTEVVGPTVNGYCSFLIAPDGSKSGWEHSKQAELARAAFIEGCAVDYVEVSFGEDYGHDCGATIESCSPQRDG